MKKAKNPYLEELGKYIPQGGNKFGGGNPLGSGINIAQQDFKNHSEIRNQHDDDADLYGSVAKTFNAHKNNLGALLGGFSEGLQDGAKRKSTAKKQEALDKYDRVMEYYRGVTEDATKRNEWYQKREFAKQKYLPQMLTYAQSVNTLDPQSRKMMLDDIMNGYNESIGEDNKVVSIDGSNPFLVTVKNGDGKLQILDTRNLFDGDANAQAVLSPLYPQYLEKQQLARQQQEFDNKVKERQLGIMEERIGETARRNDQNADKLDAKLTETIGKKVDSAAEFLRIVPQMEKIVKDYPDIFQSAMDAVWRENETPGIMTNLIKDAQNKWNPDKAKALTSMIKYINKMTLDVANGFARPNMFIEKIGSKAVPNLDMTPAAFLEILHEMSGEKKREIDNNNKRLRLLSQNKELPDQFDESVEDVTGQKSQKQDEWSKIWSPSQ